MASPNSDKVTDDPLSHGTDDNSSEKAEPVSSWSLLKGLARTPEKQPEKPDESTNALAKLLSAGADNLEQVSAEQESEALSETLPSHPDETASEDKTSLADEVAPESNYVPEALDAIPSPSVPPPATIRYAQSIARAEEMGAERAQKSQEEQKTSRSRQAAAPRNKVSVDPTAFIRSHALVICICVLGASAIYFLVNYFASMNANKSIAEASVLLDKKEYVKALESANAAVTANPQEATAYYARGRVYQALKLFKEASADYQKGLSLHSADPEILNRIGSVYLANGDYDLAIDLYNGLLSSKTQSPRDYQYANRAIAYTKTGQYQKAIDDFEQAIRMNSKEISFLAGDAYAYAQLKKPVQAISIYNSVLSRQPKNIDALVHRGWCHSQMSEDALALADMRRAGKIAPKDARPLYFEARFWSDRKQPAKAMDYFNKAIAVDSQSSEAYQARAELLLKGHAYEKAYSDYLALGKLGANSLKYYSVLATLAEKLGKQEQAAAAYTNILKTDPKDLKALAGRAGALVTMGKFQNALTDCGVILRLSPNNSQALYLRGKCEDSMGNSISAMNDFTAAINADNKNANAFLSRGNYYLQQKDWISASNDLERAIASNPSLTEAVTKRNVAQAAMKKFSAVSVDLPTRASTRYTAKVLAAMTDKELVEVGYKQLTKGNAMDAVALLQAAVSRHPNDPVSRRYLAHALADSGASTAALEQFDALVSLGGLQDADFYQQAKCYKLAGQPDKAIEIYLRILVSRPADGRALLGLAKTYADSGEPQKALKVCEDAMKGPSAGAVREFYASLREEAIHPNNGAAGKAGIDIGG
jgi:tetratricopeptide (TPR) repeat protein